MSEKEPKKVLSEVTSDWGATPDDHFGYASEHERKSKRGLEDWELVEHIPDSQRSVPTWFFALVAVTLMVALGLTLPFWGDRPGYERKWVDFGYWFAIVYLLVAGTFIYFMVRLYGSKYAGRLDSDKLKDKAAENEEK